MPFPFEVSHSDIITSAHSARWLHSDNEADVGKAVEEVAANAGYRVNAQHSAAGSPLDRVDFAVPASRAKAYPLSGNAVPISTYELRSISAHLPGVVATVHDFVNLPPQFAAGQVRALLGKSPELSVAVELNQKSGAIALYALMHQLANARTANGKPVKVVVSGVDNESRAEARLSGTSYLQRELADQQSAVRHHNNSAQERQQHTQRLEATEAKLAYTERVLAGTIERFATLQAGVEQVNGIANAVTGHLEQAAQQGGNLRRADEQGRNQPRRRLQLGFN